MKKPLICSKFFSLWIKCLCFYHLLHAHTNPLHRAHLVFPQYGLLFLSTGKKKYWKYFSYAKYYQCVFLITCKGKGFKQLHRLNLLITKLHLNICLLWPSEKWVIFNTVVVAQGCLSTWKKPSIMILTVCIIPGLLHKIVLTCVESTFWMKCLNLEWEKSLKRGI